ncbi:MAG: hypothetical protein KDL31_11275, partial [Kiritimatiellae bacterium]|nr:hypothetical protein [Kiritimatiellia bacterium]
PMTESKGRIYQAVIPAQPNPSEILYYIRAESSGLVTFDPPQASATPHRFLVTSPVLLTIAGDPAPVFAVEPPYGSLLVASGNMVRFSAPAYSNLYEGARLAVHHWEGEGSLPVQGTQLVFEALLQADSKLTWHWEYQYELISTTTLPGVAPTATWWFAWSSAQTPSALSEVTLGGQAYGFSGWWVDGTRQPNPTDAASLVASNLVMFGPRSAEARYLDAEEDVDGDGLPDWWEWFYFGGLTPDPVVDSDTDGFTNAKEYQDRTNPRNAGDTPQPPSVAHFPLQSPQSNPAPWEVRALVMDNHAVDQVTLYWTRNGESVTNVTTMGMTVSNMYEGIMPAPGTNADQFIYRIEARDAAGLKSVNGPFAFDVRYPRMAVTSGVTTGLLAGYQSATSVVVWVTNAGLADLAWTVQVYEQFDDIESGTNALTHAGLEDRWHIQQARFASPTNAWHFGAGPFGNYPDGADAALTLPAFAVPPDAILQFEHWARMEYDTDQRDDHYWDGGVIEVSTNGGLSFSQVTPIGGYPHRITENPDSPFAPETPCYGETDGWETGRVDLAHLAGAEVQVRFRFGSDRYVTEEGWYLDNVSLVVTNDLWWQWISVPGQGVLGAGSETGLVVEVTTAGFDPGEFRSGVLLARGNDPEVPRLWRVPVDLASSARLLEVTAEGPGTVVPAGEVYVNAGSTTSFWLEADTYFQIGAIYTNGYAAPVVPSNRTMGYVWTNVWSNGTLHIVFTEKLAAGWVPEWWLAEHGFTNQSPDAEAATDHDGDGMVTWQEYVARTDATNPASVALLMLSAKPEGTNGTVEWLSYTNETFRYRLESTENLPDGFGVVASNLPATPPVNAYTNAAPGFILYRVILDSGP